MSQLNPLTDHSSTMYPKLLAVIRILEVPGSNLGSGTGYFGSFCVFLQAFKGDAGTVPQIKP
jgi:hypothetical protein